MDGLTITREDAEGSTAGSLAPIRSVSSRQGNDADHGVDDEHPETVTRATTGDPSRQATNSTTTRHGIPPISLEDEQDRTCCSG